MKNLLVTLVFAVSLTLGSRISAADDPEILFIVNTANPVSSVTRAQIADLFFKKTRYWPDGSSVRFIDRNDGSPYRKIFSGAILRKSSREIELYWIGQKLYTGARAPLQVQSDAMTVSMVASFRGAIGYVSPDFKPLKGVKVVPISDAPVD